MGWGRVVWVETGLPITIGLVHGSLTLAMPTGDDGWPTDPRHPANRGKSTGH